ncbi:MAG: DUF445 family protein [Blastocatellia bacterium]|nr:DUF445 family protein [Blastocatellia bacterium]
MNLSRLLLDLSPLVVATLHGYGAAWLAVKMLFRPLRPVYLLGWQLPFTPGLIPAERERFIDALAAVIAEQLLTAKVIADELRDLKLEQDVEILARRRYEERSQPEALLQVVSTHMAKALETLKNSTEAKTQLASEARNLMERKMERDYNTAIRFVTGLVLSEDLIFRMVDHAVNDLAERLQESLAIREALRQTIAQIPEAVFTGNLPLQERVARDLVDRLSIRLDFKAILKRRFSTFSNELFEQIVYETAGREIRSITRFGAMIGFGFGVFQTLLNLLR